MAGAVPPEPGDEGAVILRHPHGRVHVEASVRPGEQAGGLLFAEQFQAHEQPEHGAAERFGQAFRLVHRPRDDGAVGPEAAVGDERVPMRMPVSPRAVRLAAVTVRAATRAISPSRQR